MLTPYRNPLMPELSSPYDNVSASGGYVFDWQAYEAMRAEKERARRASPEEKARRKARAAFIRKARAEYRIERAAAEAARIERRAMEAREAAALLGVPVRMLQSAE